MNLQGIARDNRSANSASHTAAPLTAFAKRSEMPADPHSIQISESRYTRWFQCDLSRRSDGTRYRWWIPDAAGVYAIYEAGSLAYIGSSQNLRWRLRTHLRGGRFTEPVSVKVCLFNDSKSARLFERKMLRRLRPPKNTVINVAMTVRGVGLSGGFNSYDYPNG